MSIVNVYVYVSFYSDMKMYMAKFLTVKIVTVNIEWWICISVCLVSGLRDGLAEALQPAPRPRRRGFGGD